KDQHLTGDQQITLSFDVRADEGVPPGIPMTWLQIEEERPGIFQDIKQKEYVEHRPLVDGMQWLPQSRAFSLTTALFDQKKFPSLVPEVYAGKARLVTVYRGQRIESTSDVTFHTSDNVVVLRYPPPPHAEVALQLAPGTGYGALCIVLDFSGSMNEGLLG